MFYPFASGQEDIVKDGLVLWLDAGDRTSYPGGGTVWRDLSNGGKNGTLINGPTFNSGNGGSIVFDGVDDYVTGFDNIGINTGFPFSVEIWFNITAFLDQYPSLCQLKTNTSNGWNFAISQTSTYLGIAFGSSSSWSNIKTGNVPSIGVWNHTVCIYNGAGSINIGNYKVFLNTNEQELSAAGGFNPTTQVNYLGTTNAASRGIDDFNGKMSIVKIYNRALSANEVSQNFNATRARFGV